MNLSLYFTLDEMTTSQTATRANIDNIPTGSELESLKFTAQQMDKVRQHLGKPVFISSGYRSPKVNKLVGGVPSSQHTKGEAVDFTCPNFGTPREIVKSLKSSGIDFDQLILEFDRWVHISFTRNSNRKQVLVIDHNGTRNFV